MWKRKHRSMDNTKMGKERENSYRKMKRSPDEGQTQRYWNEIFHLSQIPFSRKAKIFHSSIHVFACDFHPEISLFFGKSFPFLFLLFLVKSQLFTCFP